MREKFQEIFPDAAVVTFNGRTIIDPSYFRDNAESSVGEDPDFPEAMVVTFEDSAEEAE